MKRTTAILWALLAVLALPSLAYAYADPGAGSMLLQLLVGGAAGLIIALRIFKERLLRLFGLKKDDDSQ